MIPFFALGNTQEDNTGEQRDTRTTQTEEPDRMQLIERNTISMYDVVTGSEPRNIVVANVPKLFGYS